MSPSERTRRILNAFGNNEDVIVISNHINAGGGDGAEVIYALRNKSTLSNLILDELLKSGQNIRKAYQRRLPSDTSKDYYFIHRDTGVTEPIIIEYGFLDSSLDDVQQLKNNKSKYVDAVIRALASYINVPYVTDNTYVVQKGDSLWSISKKYNITVDELKDANNLTNNLLNIGQILIVPEKEELLEYKVYTVQKGDTLYKIAGDNNITVKELIDYNGLTNTNLTDGQIILIPLIKEENVGEEYLTYTVGKGDSLYSISKKYNTTVEKLQELNSLSTNLLSIGQVIKIPIKDIEEKFETSSYIEYVVEKGDSLYSISKKYNMSVDEIIDYNNLTSNLLNIGQIIKIPINTLDKLYEVQNGDTLYSIARKNNITVQEIMSKNNLSSTNLSIGQKLIL